MQGIDIKIFCRRVVKDGNETIRVEMRDDGQGLFECDFFQTILQCLLNVGFVTRTGQHHLATRGDQRVFSKPRWRVPEKCFAGAGHGAHDRRTVTWHIRGSRATGGMVTGGMLHFENGDFVVARQFGGNRGTGYACANNNDVA